MYRSTKSSFDGSLDAAVAFQPSFMSEKLFCEPLLEERMPVLSHPDHPLVHYKQVQSTDLKDKTLLVTEPGWMYRIIEQCLADSGIRDFLKTKFASVEAIKQCVINGLEGALLPEMVAAKEVERKQLSALHWGSHAFKITTQLCWPSEFHQL